MKKKLGIAALVLLLLGAVVGFYGYNAIWSDNVNDDMLSTEIEIPNGSSYSDLLHILESNKVLSDASSFDQVAGLMNYKKNEVPAGKYKINKRWSNRELISVLRSGRQKPIKVTFNNHRTIQETLGDIAAYLEPDSSAFVSHILSKETLDKYGYNRENILTLFIPNTYEMYWNYTPEKLMSRMKAEHATFWSKKDREVKASEKGLTKEQVYTLASIVEKESQAAHERPIIAGLYLNRLDIDMPLQADPTVVFGVGDFTIRRVLNKHLASTSPYNTYKYNGLPPGPIYLPSVESIDAVLNPTKHKYLYMCAKPGYGSEHAFANSSAQHGKNARDYHKWLNSEGIRR